MTRLFLDSMPINSMSVLMGDGGKAITAFMLDEYAKIAETAE
jgi:beta-glucosidase